MDLKYVHIVFALLVVLALGVSVIEPKARQWLSCHREYLWIAGLTYFALVAWKFLPGIDPYSDLIGLPGDLGNTVLLALRGIAAVALAYLCKSFFTTDLSDDEEAEVRKALLDASSLSEGRRFGARYVLLADRLGWVLWLGFWFFVFFRS